MRTKPENRILGCLAATCTALTVGALLSLFLIPAAPAAAQATNVEEIRYPSLPNVEIPKPKRVTLKNGMVVLLLEDHELPLVDAVVLIRTGDRLEPADKIGLASLTGTVLRTGGTSSMDGDSLDDYLESKAASIETSIGSESGRASMSSLAKDFPRALKVFADVLRNPVFDEDKIEVARTAANAGIARQNDNPQQILFRELGEIIYGEDSPYARNPTYETITSVTREDLVAWHKRYFHPDRMVLGLVGDFDAKEARKLVREAFGSWPAGPERSDPEAGFRKEARPGVFYVEKSDMTQSNIAMGHLGIRRDDPDYYPVEVMNQILGGSFASRLFSNVRSKKGLAYSVRGSVGSDWDHPGSANLWMTTKTETTGAGIEALLEEAHNMVDQPPTDLEVSKAKSSILNSFIFNSDSRRKILNQQLAFEYYGYPLDWLSRYRRGTEAVTTAQVLDAAKKHLRPDEFSILVVGPKEGQDKPLSDYGAVTLVDITIPEPEAERVEVSEEGAAKAGALLAKATEAMGGSDLVASVKSLRQEGRAVQKTPQGDMEIQATTTLVFPDRYRQQLSLPFGTITMVMTPDTAFINTPQGVSDLPESRQAMLRKSMMRDPLTLLKARGRDGFEATTVGTGEIEGMAIELVQVEVDGEVSTLGIESGTGRIVQIAYQGAGGPGGTPGEITQTFSDFKETAGLTYPFAIVQSFNGEPTVNITIDSIEVDSEIDESEFEKPEQGG